MGFRNYCIVIMGDTDNCLREIEKISEGKIRSLNAKGIVISTFTSNLEVEELDDWFKVNNRSFLVFDLNVKSSGFNFQKKDIHEGLFGFLKTLNLDKLNEELSVIFEEEEKVVEIVLTESDIEKMTPKEKKEMFDRLLDKGVSNLTENDKKIIPFLVK